MGFWGRFFPLRGHWKGSPGNGHCSKPSRAPGMCGKRSQGWDFGIVLCTARSWISGPGGFFQLRIFQDLSFLSSMPEP